MTSKVAELYSIIRGFIERGLCGDNAREVSFKTLDAFESAVREDALQQAVIDIGKAHAEGVAEGREQGAEEVWRGIWKAGGVITNIKGMWCLKVRSSVVPSDGNHVLAPTKESEK